MDAGDPVPAQVELPELGRVLEHARPDLLHQVLPQGQRLQRLQAVERPGKNHGGRDGDHLEGSRVRKALCGQNGER